MNKLQTIKTIKLLKASRVVSLFVFSLSFLLAILFLLWNTFSLIIHSGFTHAILSTIKSSLFFLFIPFLYAGAAFLATTLFCWLYNKTYPWTGGIEIELEDNS